MRRGTWLALAGLAAAAGLALLAAGGPAYIVMGVTDVGGRTLRVLAAVVPSGML